MYQIEKERIPPRIRSYFTETILSRGWNYFRQQHVEKLQVQQPFLLKASVIGAERYSVRLDLESFSDSACSCPYGDSCKHMAAVLFEALQQGMIPEELLTPRAAANSNVVAFPRKGQVEQESSELLETDSIAEWHSFLERAIDKNDVHGILSLQAFYYEAMHFSPPFLSSWSQPMRIFFRIHVWLFALKQIDELSGRLHLGAFESYSPLHVHLTQWLNEMQPLLVSLNDPKLRERYEPYYEATIDFLTHNAFPLERKIIDWDAVYFSFWRMLFSHLPWFEAEANRLRAELAATQPTAFRKQAVGRRLFELEIALGQDKQALALAEAESLLVTPKWFIEFLRLTMQSQNWDRLLLWLRWMKQNMQESFAESRRSSEYLYIWRQAYQEKKVEESEWEEVLHDLLPFSYSEFANYLFFRSRYEDWAELHLFYEASPLRLQADQVKEVEADHLYLLLPLYHQAAERLIVEKNRESYKQAVRLLKKLRARYKRLKELPRWTRYIEFLSEKYKRYRAFQEELRKGKLIP